MIARLAESLRLLAPLRLRGFRILWAGMTISLVGDGVTLIAIAWQVYQLSNVPTALGITMMAMSVPQILLLLFGVQYRPMAGINAMVCVTPPRSD